jgi:DNA helicase-2/ATP-dependent DNA helicase PcrA
MQGSDILAGLNPAQRAAVETIQGPVLILAGPGSGKTRVITHRIAYLVRTGVARPEAIMAVTFTNKAAREMRERLARLLGPRANGLTLGTFHAVCARILRRDGAALGLDPHFVIYDEDDQVALVRRALQDLNLDERQFVPRVLKTLISEAKSELRDPHQFAEFASTFREQVAARVYRRYQDLLREAHALDFDDLIYWTIRLFREQPAVLASYQDRYRYFLVDEFQDTDRAQYTLMKLLASRDRNLCVVGDEDQSIYSWRRADIRNILHFEDDFPDARVIYLEQNYRSTKTILEAARHVIAANLLRKEKRLWTENEQGPPIQLAETATEEEEAGYVAGEILRLVEEGPYRYGDIAVMYRTNAQSRVLEQVLVRRRIPHTVMGLRFYERKEVKDLLAYLRLLHNPEDSLSLRRIINVPPRGIGDRTLGALDLWARQQRVSLWTALRRLRGDEPAAASPPPIGARGLQCLLDFLALIEDLQTAARQTDLLTLMDLVLHRTGYADHIRDGTEEGEERWRNLKELATVALPYVDLPPPQGLVAFLEETALASEVDTLREDSDAVRLLTLHAAKGLEFPVVFIVGLEEGLCPHSRSLDDPVRLEEERRLFYVGMTRARERLYLVYALRRSLYGGVTESQPSRFLGDIPPHLVRTRARPSARLGRSSEPAPVAVPAGPAQPRFRPGDRVRHATFGEGVVLQSTLSGGDEIVTVLFPRVGEKRLLAGYAPLERLP